MHPTLGPKASEEKAASFLPCGGVCCISQIYNEPPTYKATGRTVLPFPAYLGILGLSLKAGLESEKKGKQYESFQSPGYLSGGSRSTLYVLIFSDKILSPYGSTKAPTKLTDGANAKTTSPTSELQVLNGVLGDRSRTVATMALLPI